MSDTTINVVTLKGAAFKVSSGDTLVVTGPERANLTKEQREKIRDAFKSVVADGVGVLVIDHGFTVSAITKA